MMQDHGDYDEDFYTDEDPFNPSDPEWQPKGGGGGSDFSIPPPASTYKAVIESWERRKPGASGYPWINMAVAIVGGDYDSRWIWVGLSYSPKSGFVWAQLFEALGWTPEHGHIDRNDDEELAKWFDSGRTFKIRTKVESYRTTEDGRFVTKKKASIKRFMPLDGDPQFVERPPASEYEPQHQLADEDPFAAHTDAGHRGDDPDDDDEMPF